MLKEEYPKYYMKKSPITRMTLLARIQSENDDFSWGEYAHYYQDYILLILKKMNVNHHDAEELCQTVLLKSWKALPSMDLSLRTSTFRSWISRITRNTAIDFFRSKSHRNKKLECEIQDFFSEHASPSEIEKKTGSSIYSAWPWRI